MFTFLKFQRTKLHTTTMMSTVHCPDQFLCYKFVHSVCVCFVSFHPRHLHFQCLYFVAVTFHNIFILISCAFPSFQYNSVFVPLTGLFWSNSFDFRLALSHSCNCASLPPLSSNFTFFQIKTKFGTATNSLGHQVDRVNCLRISSTI